MHVCISVSLSLYIYIYIHTLTTVGYICFTYYIYSDTCHHIVIYTCISHRLVTRCAHSCICCVYVHVDAHMRKCRCIAAYKRECTRMRVQDASIRYPIWLSCVNCQKRTSKGI